MADTRAFFNPFTGFQFLVQDPMDEEAKRGLTRSAINSADQQARERNSTDLQRAREAIASADRQAKERSDVENKRTDAMERVGLEQAKAQASASGGAGAISALQAQWKEQANRQKVTDWVRTVNRMADNVEAAVKNRDPNLLGRILRSIDTAFPTWKGPLTPGKGGLAEKWMNWAVGKTTGTGTISQKELDESVNQFLDGVMATAPKEYYEMMVRGPNRVWTIWDPPPELPSGEPNVADPAKPTHGDPTPTPTPAPKSSKSGGVGDPDPMAGPTPPIVIKNVRAIGSQSGVNDANGNAAPGISSRDTATAGAAFAPGMAVPGLPPGMMLPALGGAGLYGNAMQMDPDQINQAAAAVGGGAALAGMMPMPLPGMMLPAIAGMPGVDAQGVFQDSAPSRASMGDVGNAISESALLTALPLINAMRASGGLSGTMQARGRLPSSVRTPGQQGGVGITSRLAAHPVSQRQVLAGAMLNRAMLPTGGINLDPWGGVPPELFNMLVPESMDDYTETPTGGVIFPRR